MELNGLDKLRIITYQHLSTDNRNVFTLLYQPLIGCDAFTLYLTLWSLIDRTRLKSQDYLHETLYDILGCTPKAFLNARKKLEAIGLIVAYHNDDLYLYELKTPLTANEFIKDGSLGAYLLSKVGNQNFDSLVDLFRVDSETREGYKNITSHFDEVFESLPKPVETNGDFITKTKAKININHHFDFDFFLDGLSKNFVDKRKITKTVKEKIINLSYVYGLDELTMQKAFMDSVDKHRNIDLDKLTINARTWFKFERQTVYETDESIKKQNQVEYTDIPTLCKTETPSGILSILSNGGKPAISELKVVEKLIESFDFPDEVINFLLIHVIGLLEEFPSYNYFDKIAASWRREGVESVEDAIQNIKRRQQRMSYSKAQRKGKNEIPKDIESDWLDDYLKNL